MLLHGIGVGIEDGLEHIGDELLHLLRCTAHKVLRHKARHDLLAGQAKGKMWIRDRTYTVVLDTPLTEQMRTGFSAGVTLADGTALSPAEVTALSADGCTCLLYTSPRTFA